MPLKAFVVEDNPAVRQGLIEALAELAGIETAGEASNEHAAVAWLTSPGREWDLAIIDLMLEPGGGSGFGVLRALRSRRARQLAIVLTGTASEEERRECELLGSDRVFDKSMETEAMLTYLQGLASR